MSLDIRAFAGHILVLALLISLFATAGPAHAEPSPIAGDTTSSAFAGLAPPHFLGFAMGSTSASDATAPDLRTLAIAPTTIDTAAVARTVTVTARITDAESGNGSSSFARFTSPSG